MNQSIMCKLQTVKVKWDQHYLNSIIRDPIEPRALYIAWTIDRFLREVQKV